MKSRGVSLPELMVSIAVVSVVGAGLYVGFQQIDDAQQAAAVKFSNSNAQGLLLDLIETETRQAGTGSVPQGKSTCLVRPSGSSEFANDCYDTNVQISPGSSHGVMLCSESNGGFRTTFIYASGPVTVDSSNQQLQCADGSQRFFDSYSAVFQGKACGFNGDNPISQSDLGPGSLRNNNLCQLDFVRSAGGVGVNLAGAGVSVGTNNGNSLSFSFQGNESQSVVAETADAADSSVPYVAGFELSRVFVASGAFPASVELDRIALEDVTVPVLIHNGDNQAIAGTPSQVTVEKGQRVVSTDVLPGQRIKLLTAPDLLVEGIDELSVILQDPDAADEPYLSFSLSERQLAYDDNPIELVVVRSIVPASSATATISASNEAGGSALNTLVTLSAASGTASFNTDGDIEFSFDDEAFSQSITITPIQTASTNGRQDFRLQLATPDSDAGYSVSSRTEALEVSVEGNQPIVSWFKASSSVLEPDQGAIITPREERIIIRADRPATRPVKIEFLNNASSSATCGSTSDDHYQLIEVFRGVSAASSSLGASCFDQSSNNRLAVEIPIGFSETMVKVEATRAGSDSTEEVIASFDLFDGIGYRLSTETTNHQLTILPKLADVEFDTDGNFEFSGETRSALIGHVTLASAAENTYAIQKGTTDKGVILKEWEASYSDWTEASLPISVPEKLGAGTLYFESAVTPGTTASQRLTIGSGAVGSSTGEILFDTDGDGAPNTNGEYFPVQFDTASTPNGEFKLWIKDDTESEAAQSIRIQLRDIVANRSAKPKSTDYFDITLLDDDSCSIAGGGLTIGSSRANHFHTVGLNDMVNANITAGTVRISSNYNNGADQLLIAGKTPTTADNIDTYANLSITHDSVTYTGLTAKFFRDQGVMEITSTSAIPAPAMVTFFNELVVFNTSVNAPTTRSMTFTLGAAQAWDMHEDGTTHYYRFVPDDVVFFNTARLAAASSANAYFGVPGYLATVTSRAENTFLAEKFNDNGGAPAGWLGGWDRNLDGSANEGQWIWMNGPEAGRRFLSGNTTNNQYKVVRGTGNGAGTAATITRSDYQQTETVNGSGHTPNDSFELWNMYYNEYSESITNGRVTHPSNPYRFSNFARGEPNNCCGGVEHYLQMTGNSRGGRLWNDLPDELGSIIGNPNPDYGSPISPYYVRGYYQEFGGPEKSKWGFYNRKFSQTNSITMQQGACTVTEVSDDVGLTQDSCEAWSDLTIGTGTNSSSGFDFFGPSSSVSGQNITSARVSISSGYVSGTDELIIDGVTANTSTNGQKKYLNFSVMYNGTNYNNIDAIFFIDQGVMEITRYTNANGNTKANMPANAMVKLFNEKVEFVHNPSGTGLVSSGERQVTYTLGEAQAWFSHEDGGTRYYRYVPQHRTWWQARDAAQHNNQKYFGVRGYLATVTSKAENDFLADRFNDNGGPPAGWLNGRDWGSGNEGHWRWVGGPESGRRFWKGEGVSGQFISGTGNGDGTPRSTSKDCVPQSVEWNGHSHVNGYLHQLDYDYEETLSDGVPPGRVGNVDNARFANWSCYNSTNGMEPNDAGNNEDFLQINGGAKGGGMWNDLKANQASGTGVYNIKGYYIEYGGPASYSDSFSDRQLGATFRINPQECALIRVN